MAGCIGHIGRSTSTLGVIKVSDLLRGPRSSPAHFAMATLSMPTPQVVTPTTSDARQRRSAVRRSPPLKVAWVPDQDLEHPEWVAVGVQFGTMSRVSNWWIGDWIEYGTAKWGEKYAEASRITGYDIKSLRNIAYVARQVDLSRRRDKLRWSHHAEVAGLEPQEQDRWLDRCLADRFSVADLRIELRGSQRSTKTAADDDCVPDQSDGQAPSMVCPHCGKAIPLNPDDVARSSALVAA
jgi:hypothetical protein